MPSNYRRVSRDQRCQIFALIETKISVKEISRCLNLHRSTVYRELNRNTAPQAAYNPVSADEMARARQSFRAKLPKLFDQQALATLIAAFGDDLSPEQIAGRYRLCSHQTIYRTIRRNFPWLRIYLRRYGKKGGRSRASCRGKNRQMPSWYQSIDQRPKEVLTRKTLGHWERDSMYVKDRKQLLVVVERKSRFVRIAKLPKPMFENAAIETVKLTRIKGVKPLTITNDRGGEFRGQTKIKTPIYFCDPQTPQQRGTIENTIGLLRQYLTLKTDFDQITNQELRSIERKLNHRPRKCLDYRTPYEVMHDLPVALAI